MKDKINKEKIHTNFYFSARFLEWPEFSMNPHILLEKDMGLKGDLEKECEALLRDNDVIHQPNIINDHHA